VRLGISLVLAIIVVFLISFLYQVLTQPYRMHSELWQRAIKNERLLAEIENVERDKVILSELYKTGTELYHSYVSREDPDAPKKWVADMNKWLDRVRHHIKDRWSVSTLHEFNDPSGKGGWSYKRRDDGLKDIKSEHGGDVTVLYTGYIDSLDRIIRFNSGDHFGQASI
jgi:hypothetical protein